MVNAQLVKQVLKYIFMLAISIALFWFALRGVELAELTSRMAEVDYSWVGVSLLPAPYQKKS